VLKVTAPAAAGTTPSSTAPSATVVRFRWPPRPHPVVRISTLDQNEERQLDQAPLGRVVTDKAPGKDTQRPRLAEALSYVRQDDTVVAHRMDRLARNVVELRHIVEGLTARGVRVELVKKRLTSPAATGRQAGGLVLPRPAPGAGRLGRRRLDARVHELPAVHAERRGQQLHRHPGRFPVPRFKVRERLLAQARALGEGVLR
jgi:hypothetical protein